MDGKGRCLAPVFVERLGRSVQYEEVSWHGYEVVPQLASGRERYFVSDNEGRPHQSLAYRTPASVYASGRRSA
jgi:putative transposase